jgi:hypothetical protein
VAGLLLFRLRNTNGVGVPIGGGRVSSSVARQGKGGGGGGRGAGNRSSSLSSRCLGSFALASENQTKTTERDFVATCRNRISEFKKKLSDNSTRNLSGKKSKRPIL